MFRNLISNDAKKQNSNICHPFGSQKLSSISNGRVILYLLSFGSDTGSCPSVYLTIDINSCPSVDFGQPFCSRTAKAPKLPLPTLIQIIQITIQRIIRQIEMNVVFEQKSELRTGGNCGTNFEP